MYFVSFLKQLKAANAVKVARKHIQKAAQKHIKGHQRQPSLDFSVQSSEDGRALYFRKDVDSMSQDSRNGEMSFLLPGPAARAAIHKGAMSEPVRRAHRVRIHEPPEPRRGILSRMSSTDSHHMVTAPCVIAENFDLETSSQASCPNSPTPDRQNPIQEELENESNCAEQQTVHASEPRQPGLSEGLPAEPETDKETRQPAETQPDPDPDPDPEPVEECLLYPPAKFFPVIPPSSPMRVRRTLEAPATPRPSTPIRTQARSRSCPRKQTTSPHTPMAGRKSAFHSRAQSHGSHSNQVRPIPNGLCLSDSTSSSDTSTDSLEVTASGGPAETEQCEGTLQRELRALFDQKMREIRCKSPLFLDGELYL